MRSSGSFELSSSSPRAGDALRLQITQRRDAEARLELARQRALADRKRPAHARDGARLRRVLSQIAGRTIDVGARLLGRGVRHEEWRLRAATSLDEHQFAVAAASGSPASSRTKLQCEMHVGGAGGARPAIASRMTRRSGTISTSGKSGETSSPATSTSSRGGRSAGRPAQAAPRRCTSSRRFSSGAPSAR